MFGLGPKPEEKKDQKTQDYKPPEKRAIGRPHNVGWLDALGDEEMGGAKVSADPEDEVYESDNWREVIINRQKLNRD